MVIKSYLTTKDFKKMENEKGIIVDFENIIKKNLGIEDNPKADKLLNIAWEMSHSSGYEQVYHSAIDLLELIE